MPPPRFLGQLCPRRILKAGKNKGEKREKDERKKKKEKGEQRGKKQLTIYDTVISSAAGDKVFEPGIFLFREVSRFF